MPFNGTFQPGRVDRAHLKWIRRQPCCVRGCNGDAVPHHVRTAANSGTGIKPDDRFTVPICMTHHNEGHGVGGRGWQSFEAKYLLDLANEARFYATASGTDMP